MAEYDMLKQALSNAMSFNAKPIDYADPYGSYLSGKKKGRDDAVQQRAADMEAELQETIGDLGEDVTLDQIRENEVKIRSKYGDAKGARQILQDIQEEQLLKDSVEEKKSDKLIKRLMDVTRASQLDPELGRKVRDISGATEVDDAMLGRFSSKKKKGSGGGESTIALFDKNGEGVEVPKSQKAKYQASSKYKYTSPPRGTDPFSDDPEDDSPGPVKEAGADTTARENAQSESNMLSRALNGLMSPFQSKGKEITAIPVDNIKNGIDPKTGKAIKIDMSKAKKKNKE
jgi:hypothetical protein